MKHVSVHTAVDGAYQDLEQLQLVGALRFPERHGGPDDCIRAMIATMERSDNVVVITAYADIINLLGEIVERGYATGDVHLHRPDDQPTIHVFTEEGYLKDWPFGCLTPDHETHLFALKVQANEQ